MYQKPIKRKRKVAYTAYEPTEVIAKAPAFQIRFSESVLHEKAQKVLAKEYGHHCWQG